MCATTNDTMENQTAAARIQALEQQVEKLTLTIDKLVAVTNDLAQRLTTGSLIEQNTKTSLWMNEEEAQKTLSLSTSSLRLLRQNNTIKSSTATGRKIKYWRKDVERYLVENSNLSRAEKAAAVTK